VAKNSPAAIKTICKRKTYILLWWQAVLCKQSVESLAVVKHSMNTMTFLCLNRLVTRNLHPVCWLLNKSIIVWILNDSLKQVVKECWQKVASQGRILHGGQYTVTPTSREHWSRLQQSRCDAVIEDWIIFFAASTTADTPNAFWRLDNPQNAPSHGGLRPHLIRGSFYPHESAPNGISIGSDVYAQHLRVTNTDRQTDRQTDRPRYVQHL